MIITEKEQIRIMDKWNTKEKSARDLLCFFEGMEAMWTLVTDTDKAAKKQKEHLEKLHKHYDELYQVESPK